MNLSRTLATAAIATPMLAGASIACADVSSFDIFYLQLHRQTSELPPAPSSEFQAIARLITTSTGDIGTATFTVANNGPTLPLQDQFAGILYEFRSSTFSTSAPLLAAFPAGTYTFNISGGTLGVGQGVVQRSAQATWPAETPAFTPATFNSFTAVDPDQDLTVEFNGFTANPVANESLIFLFVTGDLGTEFATIVPNTTTSIVIPANTLTPNTNFRVSLFYSSRQVFQNAGFGGALGLSAFDSVTEATLVTADGCTADFNGDNTLDFFDYLDFVSAFDAEDPSADFNNDGTVDFFDYLDFVAAFDTCG